MRRRTKKGPQGLGKVNAAAAFSLK